MNLITIATAAILVLASFNEAAPANKASQLPGLSNIKHVVYFMQENRSFDMYYGTMYGVRGFSDPNVGIQANGLDLFHQPDRRSPDKINGTSYLLPFQLQGARAGCTAGGLNGWQSFHSALNNGKNDNWPNGNFAASMGYLNRTQIPFLFSLADEFTIADMYFQSVIGPTLPNRALWMSGKITGPNGFVIQDNSEAVPYDWSTYPQVLTNASVSWQVYQDKDNFDDNPLAWFKYWQQLPAGAEKTKGTGFLGLQAFYDAAANGTLPTFSIIVGPRELSEHPTNTPLAGSWLQQQVVNAVMNGKGWKDTALFINYDEAGGYYDHVQPPQQPKNEWVKDKLTGAQVPIGFGPRVPMVVISPWTRGGNVFSETSDHTSTLKFMEEFVGKDSNGKYLAPAENIQPFARQTSSNLVNIFDFDNPDYSIPKFDPVPKPAQLPLIGTWDPTAMCEIQLLVPKTKAPYGKQTFPVVEAGSRQIRGAVTEGRKIAITTSDGQAIHLNGTTLSTISVPTKRANAKSPIQFPKNSLFKLVVAGNKGEYKLQSIANPSNCLSTNNGTGLTSGDCKSVWAFEQNGAHHHIRETISNNYVNLDGNEKFNLSKRDQKTLFKIYSVTEAR